MTGRKGKSGGQRPGAGRPATTEPVRTLALSSPARQELSILTLNQRGIRNNHKLSQREFLEELIHAKWLEYDAMIQGMTEEAGDNGLA